MKNTLIPNQYSLQEEFLFNRANIESVREFDDTNKAI